MKNIKKRRLKLHLSNENPVPVFIEYLEIQMYIITLITYTCDCKVTEQSSSYLTSASPLVSMVSRNSLVFE